MSTVRIEVTDQRIADLLCSAFEGGSNYWYEIVSYVKPSEISFLSSPDLNGGKPFPHIDYPLNPGGAVVVKSMEEPEKRAVRLTKGRLERALQLMAEKYPQHWGDFLSENDDATTGDIFLQLACFGEVIYG